MHSLRHYIKIVEQSQQIDEIEKGAGYESNWDDVKTTMKGPDTRQMDMFPDMPSDFTVLGQMMGRYNIALTNRKWEPHLNHNSEEEPTFVVFDGETAAAYVHTKEVYNVAFQGHKALRVTGIEVDPAYRGRKIALNLYKWLLGHVCAFIVADESQSEAGERLWGDLVSDKQIAVYAYDDSKGRRPTQIKTTRGMEKVYSHDHWYLFATLDHGRMSSTEEPRHELLRLALLKRKGYDANAQQRLQDRIAGLSDAEVMTHLAKYRETINFKDF